jgi:hypothetical protein
MLNAAELADPISLVPDPAPAPVVVKREPARQVRRARVPSTRQLALA